MTNEEADHRLATGWHVDLEEADALCSAQRKRYLRLERERLLASDGNPADPGDPGCNAQLNDLRVFSPFLW